MINDSRSRNSWQFTHYQTEWGTRLFKLIKGITTFLSQTKKGGWVRSDNKITYIPERENCLTEDQARHVYKMVEMDKVINMETMKQEIDDDKVTRNRLKEEEVNAEVNPFQMAILVKVSWQDIKTEQMIH